VEKEPQIRACDTFRPYNTDYQFSPALTKQNTMHVQKHINF
jgi:hypothetical protein